VSSDSARSSDATPRSRRKWRRILVVGIVLSLGPILGILGLAFGIGISFRAIEASPAPTPSDLHAANARGLWIFVLSATLGMLSGLVGACLALWSYRKLRALEPAADLIGTNPDAGPDLVGTKSDPWK
jgi:hypothetical protein